MLRHQVGGRDGSQTIKQGHLRAYHGQRAISQGYVARRHLAMPATTDYWVNDRAGDPLLVITGEANAALTKAFPRLLGEVRGAVGERRAASDDRVRPRRLEPQVVPQDDRGRLRHPDLSQRQAPSSQA